VIVVADEVREAGAVVALETTLIAHGFPRGEGVAVGLESEARIRAAGAVPATIGILDGATWRRASCRGRWARRQSPGRSPSADRPASA